MTSLWPETAFGKGFLFFTLVALALIALFTWDAMRNRQREGNLVAAFMLLVGCVGFNTLNNYMILQSNVNRDSLFIATRHDPRLTPGDTNVSKTQDLLFNEITKTYNLDVISSENLYLWEDDIDRIQGTVIVTPHGKKTPAKSCDLKQISKNNKEYRVILLCNGNEPAAVKK